MRAEPHPNKILVFRDLEGITSPLEFAELVFQDVEEYLSQYKRTANKTRKVLEQLGGTEFKGFKFPAVAASHWKTLLTNTIADLMEQQESTLIFLWDEIPMMLDNIKKQSGDSVAMDVLNTLRQLRQTHGDLRMVYTGSIGLHHVITSLRRAGYANAPINDMYIQEVAPLSVEDAAKLASLLLTGMNIQTEDLRSVALGIAEAADRVPFYIHHIVRELADSPGSHTEVTVDKVVLAGLSDPQNKWDLHYYITRVTTYYDVAEQPGVLALLDILAMSDGPLTFDQLFSRLKAKRRKSEKEETRQLLVLLQRDHYIVLNAEGYKFYFPLIQRFWRLQRRTDL